MRVLIAIALLVAACGTAASPAPSTSPQADPTREAAATAYLAAADVHNQAFAALDRDYGNFETIEGARFYFSKAASIQGKFIDSMKALKVPGDSEADLQQVIATDSAEQALDVKGSALQTIDELKSLLADLRTAITASTSAALRLRTDLGIPAGPTKATPT